MHWLHSRKFEESYPQLQAARDEFERLINELKAGVPALGLPASPMEVVNEMEAMDSAWQRLRTNADDVLSNQQSVVAVREFAGRITGSIPRLQDHSSELVADLSAVVRMQIWWRLRPEQLMLAERMDKSLAKLFQGGGDMEAAVAQISQDKQRFGQLLDSVKTAVHHSVPRHCRIQRCSGNWLN